MGASGQSSLRALAPASLVLFAIAFLVVIVASLGGGDSSSSGVARDQTNKPQKRQTERRKKVPRIQRTSTGARFYTVRPGDNLSTIANRTGVPVGTLLELNPSLDPQGLVTGQRVKLPGAEGATGTTGTTGTTGATGTTGVAGRTAAGAPG